MNVQLTPERADPPGRAVEQNNHLIESHHASKLCPPPGPDPSLAAVSRNNVVPPHGMR
jgi:hypothetical protein